MLNQQSIYLAYQKHATSDSSDFLYGLADHAGMPGLASKLTQAKAEWVSLFDGSGEESALSVAPLLFRIEVDQSGIQHRGLVNWIGEHGSYSSSLLLLASPLPLPELARRLTVRLDAVLPQNMDIMLRFFDPRIFEQLMQVFSAEQKHTFLSVADGWWFADRRGQLQEVSAVFSEADPFEAPLMLSIAQEHALLDASEADQVANLLQSTVQDEYLTLPPPIRYDFIVRHMTAARLLGIEATHELALYCALALLQGEQFATQKRWPAALQEVQSGKLSLAQAAEQIEQNDSITGQP